MTMEDLFRFVALRAPDPADPSQAIDLTSPESEYKRALVGIHQSPPPPPPSRDHRSSSPPDPVQAALRITNAYTDGSYGGAFIRDVLKLPLAKSFETLYAALAE